MARRSILAGLASLALTLFAVAPAPALAAPPPALAAALRAPPRALPAAQDQFLTTSTAMNGLGFTPAGAPKWTQDAGVGGTTSNPQVPSVGVLKINSGGGVSKPAIWMTPAAPSAARWATIRLTPSYAITTGAPAGSFRIVGDVIVKTPATDYASVAFTFESAGVGLGATRLYHSTTGGLDAAVTGDTYPASSLTSKKQGDFWHPWAGDTFQIRKKTAGAVVTYDFYSGGYLIASNAVDIAAAYAGASLALNDSFGVKGDAQASTPNLFSSFESGDPCAQGMLTVKKMGHTAQIKHWDGSNNTYVPLKGEYGFSAPKGLVATVYNASTGAVAYGPMAVGNFSTGMPAACIGTWKGDITIPAASTPATFYVKVERQDMAASARAYAFTPNLNAGEIVAVGGQSITTLAFQQTVAGITVTPPANGWICDGSIDQNGGGYPGANTDFRCHISTANTAPYLNNAANLTYMMQPMVTASGNANLGITVIRCGYGGTTQYDRQPGAGHGIYEACQDGIDRVGDVYTVYLNGGTYESNGALSTFGVTQWGTFAYGTDTVTFKSQLDTLVQTIEAYVGHPIKVILSDPPGIDVTQTTTLDTRANNLRRAYFELVLTNGVFGTVTAGNPQRYVMGAPILELQHKPSDQYHLTVTAADGWGEMARRYGYSLAAVLGYRSDDRNGATLDATTTPNRTSTTLAVTLNALGATSLGDGAGNCNNTAFASDFRCGLHVFKHGTSTEIFPTGAAVGAVSGGKAVVTWTYSSADLTGTVDVYGPLGLAPYNRAQDATIAGAMSTDASMLRSNFSDPEATFFGPPVQPYFNAAFPTDNTHDFIQSNWFFMPAVFVRRRRKTASNDNQETRARAA